MCDIVLLSESCHPPPLPLLHPPPQEGRLPLHYAAAREELRPLYTALVDKGEY